MVDHLDTKNFVPFSKRRHGFQLPGVRKSPEEEMLEQVDPNLRPEDEGVIRRYLQYADTLLGSPELQESTLLPPSGTAKEPAAKAEATLESRFQGFRPDLLERVTTEGEKRRQERTQEFGAEDTGKRADARELDQDKAA